MTTNIATVDDLTIEALQHYESSPIDFIRDIVGVELDTWQKEVCQALVEDHFVAMKAGSGVGKTFLLSLLTMWFLGTKPNSKVPTTAPSRHQLHDQLWGEHHKWIERCEYLKSMMVWTQTKIGVRGAEPQWYAVARTARVQSGGKVAEGLQGFHAEENLMFIVDEASGVPDEIFPAVEGALTGKKAYAILAGNPTRLSGYFYNVFNSPEMRGLYRTFTISCLTSKYVEDRYIRMMKATYGEEHPIFQIKVLGEFPSSDVSLLFPLADIETFQHNDLADHRGLRFEPHIGVDIGRAASRSIMCIRKGSRIVEWAEKYLTGGTVDTVTITNWIVEYIQAYEPASVKIDAVGIGAGVYDNLARLYPAIVHPVLGQASAAEDKKERYANLRAQGYWELRDALPNLSCKKIPDRLISELSDLRYKIRNGKILIESKEEMQARNQKSPDYADAMMYAFLDDSLVLGGWMHDPYKMGSINSNLSKTNFWREQKRSNKPLDKWAALYG